MPPFRLFDPLDQGQRASNQRLVVERSGKFCVLFCSILQSLDREDIRITRQELQLARDNVAKYQAKITHLQQLLDEANVCAD